MEILSEDIFGSIDKQTDANTMETQWAIGDDRVAQP